MSFMYSRNRRGPNTDPGGTPQAKLCLLEVFELISVVLVRPAKYEVNQS